MILHSRQFDVVLGVVMIDEASLDIGMASDCVSTVPILVERQKRNYPFQKGTDAHHAWPGQALANA